MSGDHNDAEATEPEEEGGQYANQNHRLASQFVPLSLYAILIWPFVSCGLLV
uniref:Uncharacterized protein n=1 Tax=Oryza brachyantha TaxID=4533 RepID=J3MVN5_ORYBR